MSQKNSYRSGELASLFGISSDTLRYYERMGLFTVSRSANRYREYSRQAVNRIRLIRAALSVGFTVKELRRFLKTRDRGGIPCREVRQLLAEKLQDLQIQIQQMHHMQAELAGVLRNWDERLARVQPGEPARLLETLASTRRPEKRKGGKS